MVSRRKRRRHDVEASTAAKLLAERAREVERERKTRRKQRSKAMRDLLTSVGGSVSFRYRAQLRPFYVLAGLWLAGLAAQASANPRGVVAAAILLGVPAVLFWLRGHLERRAEQVYALCCCAAGTAWLGLAAAGLTGNRAVDVAGVMAWAVAAGLWLREHRVRDVPPQPAATATTVNERWDSYVAGKGQAADGADLEAPTSIECGQSYAIQGMPGKHHLSKMQSVLPEISSGLRVPLDELVLEAEPPADPEGSPDPSRFRLNIVTRSPIKKTVYFDRPRHDNGVVLLGPHADGLGEARFRVYTKNSMWGGYCLGSSGSGKSRLVESIAITVLDMGTTVIFYVDGQDGASSPALYQHATWAEGQQGAMMMLTALERIMARRNKQNRAHRLSGFTPTPDRPGILTIVDEAHCIFPQAPKRWTKIAREGRKVGLAVLGADQGIGLDDVFGNEDQLRTNLFAGNGHVLRTLSRVAASMIPGGMGLDPYDLPVLPGYGYQVAAAGSGLRTAPFRGRYLPDDDDKAADPSIPVPSVDEWFQRLGGLELDGAAARAAGEDYLRRHERAETERAQLLADEERGDGEDAVDERTVDASSPDTSQPYPLDSGEPAEAPSNVVEAILGLDWEVDPERTRAQIVAALEQAGTPFSVSAVQKALHGSAMCRDGGEMVRLGHGLYRPAAGLERRGVAA